MRDTQLSTLNPQLLCWAGEALALLPERAVWWQRERTLFIADPHFGKASAFRHVGIAVPETSHDDDLFRLDTALRKTAARRLVVLGDFLHARTGRSAATFSRLAAWRKRQARLEIVLVLGNHDRHAGCPPEEWRVKCVTEPWPLAPFLCCHHPREDAAGFVLAGHLHPAFHLHERIGSGLSAPCFHFAARVAVLPAFGTFTGTHRVRPSRGDQVFLVGTDEVLDVSNAL